MAFSILIADEAKSYNKHGGLAKDDKVFAQLLEFNENLEGIIKAIQNGRD